ncbi:Cell division control protein [Wickerhamomyces ciferrii]|uniref:Cell division control protein n=1 Tax=Wickerhamomyces ciferrii (strain ATCC 14091 / BCRC 22168 / CBS 111 / JCM 3599 / NBRC 0793 / NRRL Y-1031 F-60-10) TaxID=1206466 RepID=K0KYT8_WICCF|nr:Cell division control protein [Wickerhamomyces ciferrii]CCH46569.1 Cell division control protein [Wickerhamomyces ciferrii]
MSSAEEKNPGQSLSPVRNNDKSDEVKPIDTVSVIQEYRTNKANMLNLLPGDTVYVIAKSETGWWDGVIFTNNGTIRGWFPSSYTKSWISSFEQQQEQQEQQQSTLLSVLKSNLNDDKPRKNSSVSFASSEQSNHSDTRQSTKQSFSTINDPPSRLSSTGNINIVSAQEAESIFNSTGSSNVPIWVPQATTDDQIIYYNSELNIYCKELPYIETPEIDENTKFNIPTKEEDESLLSIVNLKEIGKERTNIKSRPSALSYERKSSARESSRSKSSLPSSTTVHPWNSSLYSTPDLFYYDPTDIKTWSGLRDAFIYFLQLTIDALQKKVGVLFYTYFNIASRLEVLINLASRLAQHDLQKSGYHNRVKRRLKKMSSSIAQIGINGNLYLTVSQADGSDSSNKTVSERNFSTSTQDTIKLESKPISIADSDTSNETTVNVGTYLNHVEMEVDSLKKNAISVVKVFMQISSNQFNEQHYLPQVYPRFLTGFFSGGNWSNPFLPEPKDPFAGKEVAKSLHHKRVPKTILNKENLDILTDKKNQLQGMLDDILNIIQNRSNNQARNVEVLSKVYKTLGVSSKYIDIIEGLDFSVFLNSRRNSAPNGDFDPSNIIYPILTEFFESKQDLRDIFVSIIMESQNLTLDDPTVFRSIKEDSLDSTNKFANVEPEKTAKQLETELQKIDVEGDEDISINPDKNLAESIIKSFRLLEISLVLVQQLTTEREAVLSYATRVMNEDFNYEILISEREDSTFATDEYALPASNTNRHQTKDVPWYLESEEFNLIFTNNDTVKGGTREALIQRLTHHDSLDASFNMTFLITFRSMFKTTDLIKQLIKRFNIQPPENLAYEEYTDWVEKKSQPIKLRVVNIMKTLLQKYWIPCYIEPQLANVWVPFVKGLIELKFPSSDQLFNEINNKIVNYAPKPEPESTSQIPTEFNVKTKRQRLTDLNYDEFARQLTVKEFELYSKITQTECLDKTWNKKYGSFGGFPHIQKFIANSNDLTNFVSTEIVSHNDVKKRVTVIKYFVNVAEKCRSLNNFSSMTAIISALYSSPIHRLKKTWKSVPEKTMTLMNKMNDLMNSTRNFSEYREHLRFIIDKPCVPFLGVYLSDLTFTTNGNPDHLHGDNKLVNFAKRTKTVEILREISRYQSIPYNLRKNDEYQDFIYYHLSDLMTIDEQYNRSLIIEPRVRVSQALNNNRGGSGGNSSGTSNGTKPGSRSVRVFQHFVNHSAAIS